MAKGRLAPKQARFVLEYLIDLNSTQASIRAGYSAKTAASIGWELLRKPEIQDAISRAQEERAKRTKRDADWVLQRLECLSANAEATEDFGPAVRAVELIGKHLKMFTDKVEHSGDDNAPPIKVEMNFNNLSLDELRAYRDYVKKLSQPPGGL